MGYTVLSAEGSGDIISEWYQANSKYSKKRVSGTFFCWYMCLKFYELIAESVYALF